MKGPPSNPGHESHHPKPAKPHSKSDTPRGIQKVISPPDPSTKTRLTERKDHLEKALDALLKENRRLLAEARKKRQIEAQSEDEKSLTTMLTIITDAARESPELPSLN
jgi:hypothetical protein